MNNSEWSVPAHPEEAAKRAGRRRRYNVERKVAVLQRRIRVAQLVVERGWDRHSASELARELGVSAFTIRWDVAALVQSQATPGVLLAVSRAGRERAHEQARRKRERRQVEQRKAAKAAADLQLCADGWSKHDLERIDAFTRDALQEIEALSGDLEAQFAAALAMDDSV